VEKGAALIRSFEAGTRTGMMSMMGMQGGGFQVQRLLMETAQQPDIVTILVSDVKGTILAHSNPSKIGKTYGIGSDLRRISRSQNVLWRQVSGQNGAEIFEVFRRFSPTHGHMQRHHRRMMGMMNKEWWQVHMTPEGATGDAAQVIFVGLDMGPVEAARKQDVRHAIIMALILLLIGFAGIVSLFLAQAYRSTRTSLSRVKAFSDNLVENMPIGLIAVDTVGKIASFNQTAESILHTSSEKVVMKSPQEVLPPPMWELIDRLKTDTRFIDEEIECPITNRKSIPLEVIATTIEGGTGTFLGHVILFRDLSEIQHLKKEIERSQRLASIGKLAAGIAHEIRNPLSSIKGFATYFKERYREVPEDQNTAEIMIQEVERLNKVITQLLEFARPMKIKQNQTSLQALAEQSLKMIEGEAYRKGVKLALKSSPDVEEIMVDPDRFKQVFLNLFLNALESMEKGGSLSIEIRRDKKARNIQVIISDTGKGIKEGDLAHIFDPYFTTKSSGTGLGLAIVHKIIESHGGKISVQSQTGKGTKVTILLFSFLER
jgi:two-component system sensor histidine kinase HydH